MKTRTYILSLLLFVLSMHSFAQSLYVGSYNIRYSNNDDVKHGNGWENRRAPLCDMINFEHPDIFGAQEVLHVQLMDMLQLLDNYDYIGCGRDDGKEKGEYSPIFYDKRKIKLLDSGRFWLSETPEEPSLGWDAACKRICTWGAFEYNYSGKRFYFFNLHMDHVGVVARKESAKLVLNRIHQIAGDSPVVLTGDFNVDQNDEIYKILTGDLYIRDCYAHSRIRFAENGTFNDYNQSLYTTSRIDHVYVTQHFNIDRYGILTNTYWIKDGKAKHRYDYPDSQRRLISDHYPVFVHLSFY